MTMFKPNHLSQRAPFFSLIIFYLFMLPSLQHCQQIIPEDRDPPQYTPCNQPFNCGNISNISYPFWAGSSNRPQECGRSGFELTNCENSTQLPRIKIKDLNFYVSNINNSQLEPPLTITIARSDLWDSPCTDLLVNTTLDSTRFSYVQPVRNLTLYYGCLPQNDDYAMIHRFMCKFKDKNVSYYGDDSVSRVVNRTSSCSTKIRVPISGDGFDFIVSENATEAVEKLLRQGIQIKYSAQWDLCRSCLKSNGICGSNSSTDSFLCFCRDRPYSSTCPTTPTPSEHRHFLIGAVGILVFFCMFCGVKLSIFDGNDETNNEDVEAFIQKIGPLAVKRYKFLDVIKMTYSFKDKLGQGGYGDVYKGKLLNDDCAVAVKVLKESRGNGEDFVNEVASMSRTSHVNVATLLGYCFEGRNKALVYEFMPNGSLEKFIYKERNPTANTPRLELEILFQIAIGIARGLEYLHRGCNAKILHFDIKPHNILLDENFCPKISDFGLSKLCTRKESYISMLEARGTVGYIAPEVFCRNFGGVSAKSDVYSYGMMILEMVGGRKNVDARVSHTSEIYFPDWVYEQLEQGSDCRLLDAVTENTKEVSKKMILVGLWCIQTRPSDRPSMTKVIDMLEGSIEALQMPPKPLLSAPLESSPESCTISILC